MQALQLKKQKRTTYKKKEKRRKIYIYPHIQKKTQIKYYYKKNNYI